MQTPILLLLSISRQHWASPCLFVSHSMTLTNFLSYDRGLREPLGPFRLWPPWLGGDVVHWPQQSEASKPGPPLHSLCV